MDFAPYAVGGAASRPDSFTGLNPQFSQGLYGMLTAAHAAGIPLQVTSAYRSPELQSQLYNAALEKYGSPEEARKWVAPPGRSQHNFGTAADFAVNGSLIRDGSSAEARWIRENAANYGLAVPMEWEPWQVEMQGARDQASTRNADTPEAVAADTRRALGLLDNGGGQMAAQEQPQGLLGMLGIQKRDEAAGGQTAMPFYQRDKFKDVLGGLAAGFNSMRLNPDQAIPQIVQAARAGRQQQQQANRTIEWLRSQPGGERFAEMANAAGPQAALQAYQASQQGPETTSGMQNYQFLISQGVDPQTAMQRAFSGGTQIQIGANGQPQAQIGTVPPGFQAVPDGSGGYMMSPIPGGPADIDQSALDAKAAAAAESGAAGAVNVLEKVNELRSTVSENPFASGLLGAMATNIPGTGAYDAAKTAGTVKANLGFDRLTQMRAESPTGGALGSVSQMELDRLESTIASLDLGQSKEQILENLNDIEAQYTRILKNAYATGDPSALDQVFGGRPSFLGEGGPAGGGNTLTFNPDTGGFD